MRKQFMLTTEWIKTDAGCADDAALGAWVRLHSYCAQRLNDGRLAGAKTWNNDTCQRVCSVKRRALDGVVSAGLAEWEGDDLVLKGYDHEGQRLWQAKSHGGKLGRGKQLAGTGSGSDSGSPQQKEPALSRGVPESVPRRDSDSECESDTAAAAADSTRTPDPRLAAVAAEGGYLDFKGEDLRGQWIADLGDDSVEKIREVMRWGRQRTSKPVRMPSAYCDHRAALVDAKRRDIERQRQQAESESQRAQERAESDSRAKAAVAAAARQRAHVAAILALSDEWTDRLTEAQAAMVGELRTAYDAGKPLGLILVRYTDKLPHALVEQAKARASEHTEEGITA